MEVLKNRMENGSPFLKARALERIQVMLDSLEITEQQAMELRAIAEAKGADILPMDAMGRLTAVEQETRLQRKMLQVLVAGDTAPQEVK